jgi:aspartyl-tRNA(Asn)/glutamyl-tRNA(Gln) amidotransferase subunit B
VELVEEGEISTRAADDVFETMVRTGEDPEDVVDERNLRKVGDEDELQPVIEEIIEQNPDQVEEFKQGKEGVIDYFVGQVMQKTGGSADPSLTKELLKNELA